MAIEFVKSCKRILENLSDEEGEQSPKEKFVKAFIKKHKEEISELIHQIKEQKEIEKKEQEKQYKEKILQHLIESFPDCKNEIPNLDFEYVKRGEFHTEYENEHIPEDISESDLDKLFANCLDNSLIIYYRYQDEEKKTTISSKIFEWDYSGTQEWERINHRSIAFYGPKEKINLLDMTESISKLKDFPFTYLQVIQIGMEVLDFIFEKLDYDRPYTRFRYDDDSETITGESFEKLLDCPNSKEYYSEGIKKLNEHYNK